MKRSPEDPKAGVCERDYVSALTGGECRSPVGELDSFIVALISSVYTSRTSTRIDIGGSTMEIIYTKAPYDAQARHIGGFVMKSSVAR